MSDNYGMFGDRHIRWKPDRNVPLLEMNTPEYVIPCDCLLLQTASIITGFYSQKKRIIRRIILLPVQRYNRLIKILDKPPSISGGHVSQLSFSSWNIFFQFKLILMIYGSFASLYNVPSTLMCLKTSRKTLISAKSLNFSPLYSNHNILSKINILLSLEMFGLIDSTVYSGYRFDVDTYLLN